MDLDEETETETAVSVSSCKEAESSPCSETEHFEPVTRARSNTWPLPKPDNFIEEPSVSSIPETIVDSKSKESSPPKCSFSPQFGPILSISSLSNHLKKNSSRRNAWGNLSYADLITQAITSSPDNRLTLSQIYEWMVHNVPYFKDKGDNNSSAGWKNSIRHNLSLHNRFMRVQNEGTGKSSWWILNPEAKPGKSVRRRATSMETSKFEKRRGRVKRKVEALRAGLSSCGAASSSDILSQFSSPATSRLELASTSTSTVSPSSSISAIESVDLYLDAPIHPSPSAPLSTINTLGNSPPFQSSGAGFRTRASSNASSCSRVSPMPPETSDWSVTFGSYGEHLAGNGLDHVKIGLDYSFASNTSTSPARPQPQPQLQSHSPPHQPPALHMSPAAGSTSTYLPSPFDYQAQNSFLPTVLQQQLNVCSPLSFQSSDSSPADSYSSYLNQNMNLLDDLNINIESLDGGDFNCNVDEVIQHELSLGGCLNFNFSSGNGSVNNSHSSEMEVQSPSGNFLYTPSVPEHHLTASSNSTDPPISPPTRSTEPPSTQHSHHPTSFNDDHSWVH